VLADYVFDSERRRGAVILVLGYGMLNNYPTDPNLEYDQDDAGVVTFSAIRSIAPGEELTIWYATGGGRRGGATPSTDLRSRARWRLSGDGVGAA
jgi:hypothetical protein